MSLNYKAWEVESDFLTINSHGMAYNEQLEDRVSLILRDKNITFEAKKMMGGLCFMVNDKMCIGIIKYTQM